MLPSRLPLTRSADDSSGITYTCTFCSFRSSNGIEFVKHFFQAHAFESNFRYACGISSCNHIFTTGTSFETFRGHCARKHHNWQHCFIPTVGVEEAHPDKDDDTLPSVNTSNIATHGVSNNYNSGDQDMDTNQDMDATDFNMPYSFSTDECESECISSDDVRITAAKFLLILKERFKLTQASLDYTIKAVEDMMLLSANVLRQSIMDNRELATAPFDVQSPFVNPFVGLKTEYQQTKFFKENFGLIEPVSIKLGTSFRYQQTGSARRLVEFDETCQYIPLLENLERLLNNADVLQEVTRSHVRNDHLICDFCDASLYKNHSLFGNTSCSDVSLKLQFIIYYDEVEVTNPLGSHRGKHKLALFYYVLGNIRPKYRSSLKTIQLIGVVTYPLLKEFGFESVLQPFINDMNQLRKGSLMTIEGKEVFVKGAVLAMLADTQAAHSIGGFKIGVGFSLRKCRNCLATKETMSVKFREDMFVLRTSESYDYHCSLMTGSLSEADSVTYGINYKSELNKLEDFHVCNNQLPQDVMHILLEGVIPYTVKAMLQSFICVKHFFTIDRLNQRISSFKFSRTECRSKPSPIPSSILHDDGSIHQSATQMWNLAVYLPLMVGDLVPEDDEQWECFLLLLDILQICISPVISVDVVKYLTVLIEMYLSAFCKCYPDRNIIPKQHYMIHFPSQILKLGPLTSSWCMRMEAKNSYFKRIAQQGNFKNIALSVARRHQKLMCAYLNSDNFFEREIIKSSGEQQGSFSVERDWIQKSVVNYFETTMNLQDATVTRFDWIEWQGNKYSCGDVLWCGYQHDELPEFGKLCDIMIIRSQVFFTFNLYTTKGTDRHHNSFVIESTTNTTVKLIGEDTEFIGKLHSLQTHSLRSSQPGTLHIVIKYFIFKM